MVDNRSTTLAPLNGAVFRQSRRSLTNRVICSSTTSTVPPRAALTTANERTHFSPLSAHLYVFFLSRGAIVARRPICYGPASVCHNFTSRCSVDTDERIKLIFVTYTTLCWKGILVPSKITVAYSRNLSRTLADFSAVCHDTWTVVSAVNLIRPSNDASLSLSH